MYSFLEFIQRAGIKPEFKFKEEGGDQQKWIDRALETYHFRLRDFLEFIGQANINVRLKVACEKSFKTKPNLQRHVRAKHYL